MIKVQQQTLLKSGQIDAFIAGPPVPQEAVLAANKDFAASHPALTKEVVAAVHAAVEYVLSNKTQAAERRVSWVEVATADGRRLRGLERIAPGHWETGGMPWDDLAEKSTALGRPPPGPRGQRADLRPGP